MCLRERLQEALFKLQGDVIRHISKRTDAVIIGRCADYILRERTDAKVLSVFVSAPMDACIRRKMEQKGITEKEAEALSKRSTRIAENTTNSIQERTGAPRTATISIWTAADSPWKK